VNDGETEQSFQLNRSYYGFYIPNMFWRQMKNFSTNSLALIVCNTDFFEEDYIRDYEHFKKQKIGA
jgi:hypothetical protein